ncbi:family 20 glycosylhydrolase [Schaalia sp. Marseille-Q2122]|uniref:family 20 glycosylhydrolase n=1 Tax=Schaalia sp. Marseille-Q2122 TaxID=2736604 RepID=UPI00158833E5|nr:family 20 glycosylhydrolase [Schaalia sp. Marseille-Q2122]
MSTSTSASADTRPFTARIPAALVPLPAVINGVARSASTSSMRWVLENARDLQDEANAGVEILAALRLRGWEDAGDSLCPATVVDGEKAEYFRVETLTDEGVGAESYRLRCLPTPASAAGQEAALVVQAEAATPAGFFYAGHTLAALAGSGALQVGCLVEDAPRFAHRGLMVDVARSFLPVSALRDLIAAVASLKINVLHLHLVDDQGWRMEMTNEGREADDPTDYTALHRVGGLTACNPGSDPGFDIPGAAMSEVVAMNAGFESIAAGIPGYYTQAELRSLVAYAADLHVRLVPELEFPGHNHVVLHALPHLATAGASTCDEGEGVAPWTRWQVGHSYLDFGNEDTWRFARHVMAQVRAIFGGEHLHLGGDEALKMLRTLGQDTYDEVVARVVALAKTCGFERVTLWQEGAMALESATDSVQLWNYGAAGEVERLLEAAGERQLRIINSDARHVYLDQKIRLEDVLGLTWACPEGLPTRQTYEWDPLEVFPPALRGQVIGVEACLWSETVRGAADAARLIFPRLLAIAEVAWSPQEARKWSEFDERAACEE